MVLDEVHTKEDDYEAQQQSQLIEGIIEYVNYWDKLNKSRKGKRVKKRKV